MRIFGLYVLYGFLGFLLETGFSLARTGQLVNRKTQLLLPLCPVYGLSAVVIVMFSEAISANSVVILLISTLVCSVIEYGYSLLHELAFHVRLWDYGDKRGALHGRIHLAFSACWGVLALAMVTWIQPMADRLVAALPSAWFSWAIALVATDAIATAILFFRFGRMGGRMIGCPVAQRTRPSA